LFCSFYEISNPNKKYFQPLEKLKCETQKEKYVRMAILGNFATI
jgi:hypothetical protein